jgi:hydrogenase maturation protease
MKVKPILLFGYGNPSRGDDALGPQLLEELQCAAELPLEVELVSDFQLQIEHALDLEGRRLVLFADASVACAAPYAFGRVQPACDQSYSTHAMSPSAVLQVYRSIKKAEPPPCFLLAIKGESFGLGDALSAAAQSNLRAAFAFTVRLLGDAHLEIWQGLSADARSLAA